MRGYGNSPGSEVMGLGDWLQVSQSISAIGQTIDRKRQQERQNTIEDQDRLKEEEAAQAFNYFIENPEAMDFDNPEKQTAKPSAIGEVAGIPTERPRLPIEDYSPEAIAKARVAAMSYWTNKKTLSAESLRQTAAKAKQDKDEFIKGISLAATSLANGDETGATVAFVTAYNQFYPDAHKMRVNDAGEFIMSSPTGAERNMGKPNMEQMIDEFLGSPAINEKAFAQMALMNKRGIQEMNRKSAENYKSYYSKADGKEYFAYAQIDPETYETVPIVATHPPGWPNSRTLTAEEIDILNLQTEDAVKFSEDRETHDSNLATAQARQDYYKTKGAGDGKMSQAEKEADKQEDKAWEAYEKNQTTIAESKYKEPYAALDPDLQAEVDEQALELTQRRFKDFSPDGGGMVGNEERIPAPDGQVLPKPEKYKGKRAEVSIDGQKVMIHSDGANWIRDDTGEPVDLEGNSIPKNQDNPSAPPQMDTTPASQSAIDEAASQSSGFFNSSLLTPEEQKAKEESDAKIFGAIRGVSSEIKNDFAEKYKRSHPKTIRPKTGMLRK